MKTSGTIYQSSNSGMSGEKRIALTAQELKRFRIMRILGANLSSFAIAFAIFFYGPNFEQSLEYEAGLASAQLELVDDSNQSESSAQFEPKLDVGENEDQFSLSIPAIGASASVIEDVNPYLENDYQTALKKGVAHAMGTAKPGQGRRIFLFAHSTSSPLNFSQYNAIFYQLRLLEVGEKIFVRYEGGTYIYTVKEKKVVEATDTKWLTDPGNAEQLVLQTCDPPGTTLRRLLVIAEPGS